MSGARYPDVDVAIIGGGVSGASVALNIASELAKNGDDKGLRIALFEPRETPGAGLAYDTEEQAFRLNVAADRMSLFADRPDDFARWLERRNYLETDPDALTASGGIYAQRQMFGLYMAERMSPLIADGFVQHLREKVCAVERDGDVWHIRGEGGAVIRARICVLATSHPLPRMPQAICSGVSGSPLLIDNPQNSSALADIGADESILIAGTGLSCADVISVLKERGHKGPITIYSRRGLCSRSHPAGRVQPYGDFSSNPSTRALDLLRRVRATIARAASEGIAWQAVFDALRKQGRAIWAALPVPEKRRLVRHLRRFWDVHRFRLPPQASMLMAQGFRDGWLHSMAGEIIEATCGEGRLFISFRHAFGGGRENLVFNRLVMTTGPAHHSVLESQPWLASMHERGLLVADAVGLGIACSTRSLALNAAGEEISGLYIAGPLARGTFGELMGVPEIGAQTAAIAADIVESI